MDETMYGSGTLDEASKRRSVYFTMKRSKLIPSLVVFDAPDARLHDGLTLPAVVAVQVAAFAHEVERRPRNFPTRSAFWSNCANALVSSNRVLPALSPT